MSVVEIMKAGDGVSIIPLHAELTTEQALDAMAAEAEDLGLYE